MNLPELRFPEFSGEWEEHKLGKISQKVKEKNKKSQLKTVFSNSAVNGLVAQNDFFDKDIANKNNLSGYYIVKGNYFVYNPRISKSAPVGPINRNKSEIIGLVSPLYTVFLLEDKEINSNFLENYFLTDKWHAYMRSVANYGARHDRMNITDNNLFEMPIKIPSPQEQEKIAFFLSKIDKKIEYLDTIHQLWENYKKGMMQQIFCQKLRFKDDDGNEYSDWDEKEAKKIFRNHSQKNKNVNQKLPILAVTQNNGVVNRDLMDIDIKTSPKSINSYKIIEPGDFVISLRSFQGGIEYSNIKGLVSPAYTVLKSKIIISDEFYKHYFKKEEFISRLNSAVIGIREGKQISYSVFSDIIIPYPSFEEQKKIANFLSVIDSKIEHMKKLLKINRNFRRGLLQQMFC